MLQSWHWKRKLIQKRGSEAIQSRNQGKQKRWQSRLVVCKPSRRRKASSHRKSSKDDEEAEFEEEVDHLLDLHHH
jgi:hypothetical protein